MSKTDTFQQFIQLVNNTLLNTPLPKEFSVFNAEELLDVAKMHDMAHLVWRALSSNRIQIAPNIEREFQIKYYHAIKRIVLIEKDVLTIKSILLKYNIDFIMLKGAYIRNLYPEPWMRISSDIDVLIKQDQLALAECLLEKNAGFHLVKKYTYDDVLVSTNGISIELHFSLSEKKDTKSYILQNVWDHCSSLRPGCSEYVMDDDYLYFYHMAHASKHFLVGGCGVRAVVDTWMLNHRIGSISSERDQLLNDGDLLKYAKKMESVSDHWFSESTVNASDEVEYYILSGGVFGKEQYIAAEMANHKNRITFLTSRFFLPYRMMRTMYPILRPMPFLLPFLWIYRAIKNIRKGKLNKIKTLVSDSQKLTGQSERISEMFQRLDLNN